MLEYSPKGWELNGTGSEKHWFKRYEFSEYARLRRFLDGLAALSEETGVHPDNIGFGRDYANVSMLAPPTPDDQNRIIEFVDQLDKLFEEI